MKLHHAAILSRSEERADQFFKGLLGLKRIKAAGLDRELTKRIFDIDLECELILYGNEHFNIEVFINPLGRERKRSFEHLCLVVDDREAFASECRNMRLPVKWIPRGESTLLFIEDFDGNLYEIKERVQSG